VQHGRVWEPCQGASLLSSNEAPRAEEVGKNLKVERRDFGQLSPRTQS
jgi:hypothetical protein